MSSTMAIGTCWALLLLSTILFPLQAIAGRQLPAGPPASSTQTPPRLQVPAAPVGHVGSGGGAVTVGGVLEDGTQFQDRSPPPHRKIGHQGKNVKHVKRGHADSIYGHRLLVGSSPPTCQGKCGACYPCSPIHMAIGSPHGALTQQEYYPEVWRCKCGGTYFMP